MKNLFIERTQETPEIHFDYTSGELRISGRAYSSDISMFFKQMRDWLEDYLQSPKDVTVVELQLEYYNSIFIKLIFYFLERCKELIQKGKKLVVRWRYQNGDEESMEDAVRIFKIVNLPFEAVGFD